MGTCTSKKSTEKEMSSSSSSTQQKQQIVIDTNVANVTSSKSGRISPRTVESTSSIINIFAEKTKVVTYNGIQIRSEYPHINNKIDAIVEAPKFKKWLDDFNSEEITFKEFVITDVDFWAGSSIQIR